MKGGPRETGAFTMPCYKPIELKPKRDEYYGMIVPCGKCYGCRKEMKRQWAIRCVHESKMHEENCFVTLTYRDEELTYGGNRPTLYPRHLQLFLKRLRKEYGPNIKYFGCGEYGDTGGRPHYHANLFGVDFKDKKLYTIKNGHNIYSSGTLDRLWGHGFCTIGSVTFESAAYVAKYVVVNKDRKEWYEENGVEPEFGRMSRGGRTGRGLGATWFDKYWSDIYNHDYLVLRSGAKCRQPRYYDSLFEKMNPEKLEEFKKIRRMKAFEKAEDNFNRRRLADRMEVAMAKEKMKPKNLL